MKILIVEDNLVYRKKLETDLIESGYELEILMNFDQCLQFDYSLFELIILDIGLPNLDGRDLISFIKKKSNAKIIMLTSDNTGAAEYKSLLLGADDYIIKPHYLPVLKLKIDALINKNNEQVSICGHSINTETLTIDQDIKLTAKEYKILMAIYRANNFKCTKEELLRSLWESDFFVEEGALYTMVYRLRKKLETTNINIVNTRGGYKIDD